MILSSFMSRVLHHGSRLLHFTKWFITKHKFIHVKQLYRKVKNNRPQTMAVESFVSKQLSLLELEKEAEVEENRCLQENRSLHELQKKGVCIPKLHVASYHTGLYRRSIFTFEPFSRSPLPTHSIKSGDIVGIGHLTCDGKRDILASGVVTHVNESTLSVAFEESFDSVGLENDVQYIIIKLANEVTYKRLKKTLKNLHEYTGERSSHIINVLFGDLSPTTATTCASDLSFFNQHLNETQKEAVKFALCQKEVAVIHGPPGTGKTTTIVETILQSILQDFKVLVCAPSNVAVDHLVEKLIPYRIKLVRLGHPARFLPGIHRHSLDAVISRSHENKIIEDMRKEIDMLKIKMRKIKENDERRKIWEEGKQIRKELAEREKAVIREVLKRADVVLSTLTSATCDGPLKHLPRDHFDVAVIDECSQALEASCWIPLLLVPKCILAGDHLQLPPTIISDKAAKDGLAETLMERLIKLHGNDIVKMLTLQYRMHQNIMEWPSLQLYDNKLKAHQSVSSHLLKDLPDVEENDDTVSPLILIDTVGCDMEELEIEEEESKGNEGEADLVSIHAENLVKSGIKPSDIAVISPYNLQVDLIRLRLSDTYPEVEIKSVDGFQGREKEAVILSLVRSNSKGEVGFLAEDRRINVAITRARRQLTVICNSETVSHHPFLKSFVDYIGLKGELRSAYQYESEIGKYSSTELKILSKKSTVMKNLNNQPKGRYHKLQDKDKKNEKNLKQDTCSSQTKPTEIATHQPPCRKLREEVEAKLKVIIEDFLKNGSKNSMKFSPSLDAFERRIVHEVSEQYKISHVSQGEGTERYIEITKHQEVSKDAQINKLHETPKSEEKKEKTYSKSISLDHQAESVAPLKEEKCSFCGKVLPQSNVDLHRIHCKKVQATMPEKKKSKPKTSTKNIISTEESDDFDTLIAKAVKADNTCSHDKCKISVAALGQVCQFCNWRFCYSHFVPECHGCGEAARSHARSQLRKEGKLYSGSGKPQRKLDPVKQSQLHHKLDKKISELSKQRKAKPKS